MMMKQVTTVIIGIQLSHRLKHLFLPRDAPQSLTWSKKLSGQLYRALTSVCDVVWCILLHI